MSEFLQQVLSLLTTNPGSLAYNLVLAFSILAALLAALSQARSSAGEQAAHSKGRLLLGLSLLLVFRLALFMIAGLAWQHLISAGQVLPIVERSADLLSLLVIVWLWAFPASSPLADLATLILGILLVTLTVLGIAPGFRLGSDQAFNGSTLDGYTQAAGAGLALLGILLLAVRRPAGWSMGVVMLAILAAGHLIQLWLPVPGDYPSAVRLSQMIAYPLLIVLPFRQPALAPAPLTAAPDQLVNSPDFAALPDRMDPSLQALFLEWISAADPRQAGVQLAARLAGDLQAELCLFIWPPDDQGVLVARYGYDLFHRLPIPDLQIASQAVPVITQAFQQGHTLRLPGNSTVPDLHELARLLDLQRSGALLSAPVQAQDGHPLLQVLMLLPFSGRRWTSADQDRLAVIATPLAYILQRNRQIAETQVELALAREALQSSQERVLKAENDRRTLLDMVTIMQQTPVSDGLTIGHPESGTGQRKPASSDSSSKGSGAASPAQSITKIGGDGMGQSVDQSPASVGGSERE